MRNVLLVESDRLERERLAAALGGDGFEFVLCPRPTAPDYTCVERGVGRCPLATDWCVVVIDMDQDGDAAVSGTSAEELLDFYLQAQHPVVTLSARPIARDDARPGAAAPPRHGHVADGRMVGGVPEGYGASGRKRLNPQISVPAMSLGRQSG